MNNEDLEFLSEIVEKSSWLFYGDLDEYFDEFVKKVFKHELKEYGFGDIKMEPDFAVAYWLFLSELNSLDLISYGTSPRGAWLSEKGERFKKIIMENDNPIYQANEFIYKKYNE